MAEASRSPAGTGGGDLVVPERAAVRREADRADHIRDQMPGGSLCSQSAHDQNVLARWAQSRAPQASDRDSVPGNGKEHENEDETVWHRNGVWDYQGRPR